MNRIAARFAGAFSDAFEKAGGAPQAVQGAIFEHPDFERLENAARRRGRVAEPPS